MEKMKKSLAAFLAGFPAVLLCAFLLRGTLAGLAQYLPGCFWYDRLHILCPSCGNTRSVLSLLSGDVVSSLRYNVAPVLLLLILTAFYIESAAQLFGKKLVVFPRKTWFIAAVITGLVAYYVVRNFIPFF